MRLVMKVFFIKFHLPLKQMHPYFIFKNNVRIPTYYYEKKIEVKINCENNKNGELLLS